MTALAGLVAHGGVVGAVVEAVPAAAVLAVAVVLWLRSRRREEEEGP